MNPLVELKQLLSRRAGRQTGAVLSITDGQADLATSSGVQTVPLGGMVAAVGDRLVLEQGVVIGRLTSAAPRVYSI